MKRYLTLFGLLFAATAYSQCTTCTPDETCVSDNDFPSICPEFMPPATAGEYYEDYLTFYMPATVTDPQSGITADLLVVEITNVQGLPYGIEFTMNNANSTYYPPNGETHGCATLCGTPLLPGLYDVVITTHVTVMAFGIESQLDQNFITPFTVLAGTGGNSSFTYDNIADCGSLDVNFEALIDASPQLTTYQWDFGNGNSSSDPFPPTQNYNELGEQTVSLETTLWDFVLTDVTLTSIGDGWGNDLDEGFGLLNPDPYFVITNGEGVDVFTSASLSGVLSGTWTGLTLILDTPPYTLSVYDEDTLTPDDFLGSWDMNDTEGSFVFNSQGNSGSIVIISEAGDVFFDEEVVTVFPLPTANFEVFEDENLLVYNDSTLENFMWTFNGDTLVNVLDSSLVMGSEGGIYECLITNNYGCSSWSTPYVHCPEFAPLIDAENAVFTAPDGFGTYQWYFNGLPIDGAIGSTVDLGELGNYSVEITTDYGCTTMSEVFTLTSVENLAFIREFEMYPNPSDGRFTLHITSTQEFVASLQLMDLSGKILWENKLSISGDFVLPMDFTRFGQGSYIFQVLSPRGQKQQQIIIR